MLDAITMRNSTLCLMPFTLEYPFLKEHDCTLLNKQEFVIKEKSEEERIRTAPLAVLLQTGARLLQILLSGEKGIIKRREIHLYRT